MKTPRHATTRRQRFNIARDALAMQKRNERAELNAQVEIEFALLKDKIAREQAAIEFATQAARMRSPKAKNR